MNIRSEPRQVTTDLHVCFVAPCMNMRPLKLRTLTAIRETRHVPHRPSEGRRWPAETDVELVGGTIHADSRMVGYVDVYSAKYGIRGRNEGEGEY